MTDSVPVPTEHEQFLAVTCVQQAGIPIEYVPDIAQLLAIYREEIMTQSQSEEDANGDLDHSQVIAMFRDSYYDDWDEDPDTGILTLHQNSQIKLIPRSDNQHDLTYAGNVVAIVNTGTGWDVDQDIDGYTQIRESIIPPAVITVIIENEEDDDQ